METLVLDGKRYVKASKAASNLGYTSDYVGQLCRSGQVRAHLVGRTWYVDEEQLSTHRVEKKRMSRVKAREYARKTLAEYRAQPRKISQKSYDKVAIRYEADNESLIPEPRKLDVESESTVTSIQPSKKLKTPEPKYEIENPGEKIVLNGKLNVIDLNDGEILPDEHTVLMKARVNRKVPTLATTARSIEPLVADSKNDYSETSEDQNIQPENKEVTTQRKTFAERLMTEGISEVEHTSDKADQTEGDPLMTTGTVSFMPATVREPQDKQRVNPLALVFGLFALLLIGLGSVVLEQVILYDASSASGAGYTKEYNVNIPGLISEIRSKI